MAPKASSKENGTRIKKTKKIKSVVKVEQKPSILGNPTQYLRIKCPICFENINKDAVSSTKCGHVFCTGCLRKALKRMSLCPTCRTRLRGPRGHHPLYLDTTLVTSEEALDDVELLSEITVEVKHDD